MKSYFWVKVRHSWLDDDVIGTLASEALKWRYLQLYLAAGVHDQGGALPPVTRLAYRLRLSVDDLEADLAALLDAGLVCQHGDAWAVTRFAEEQARASDAERAELYRERQRARAEGSQADVDADVDVDVETELDEDIEKEKTRIRVRETTDIVTSCDRRDHHKDDHGPFSSVLSAWAATRPDGHGPTQHDKDVLADLTAQHGAQAVIDAINGCAMSATEGRFNLLYLMKRLDDPTPKRGGDDPMAATWAALARMTGETYAAATPPPKVLDGGVVIMPTATRHKDG